MTRYSDGKYDPNAFEQPGPPLRPFNRVQRLGYVVSSIGMAIILVEWAGKLGLTPRWIDDAGFLPIAMILGGMMMVGSRRGPPVQVGSEQLDRNKRVLIIVAAICAVVLGIAAVLTFTGA